MGVVLLEEDSMARFEFTSNFLLKRATDANLNDVYNHIKSKLPDHTVNVRVNHNSTSINRANSDFRRLNRSMSESKDIAEDMASVFANATRRFAGVSIATATLLGLVRGVKNAYGEALEFERQMYRISMAQETAVESTKQLNREITALSVKYGINAVELAKTGTLLAQAGYNAKTTSTALGILSKISLAGTFGTTEENVEGMIAILQQFGKQAIATGTEAEFLKDKFDVINLVSKKYAVESSDIITAVSKAGASFESAGGTLEEFIASITAVRSSTRESASTIANSFKTIFTRIQKAETIDQLRSLGVELVDLNGKFIGPNQAMKELAKTLSVLDKGDVRFAQIAESVGGIYQVSRLITLLKQQEVVESALNDTKRASGSIDEDAAKAMETTINRLERLKTKFGELIKMISESDTFKFIIDAMIKLADSALTAARALEPLLPMMAIAGAISGGALVGKIGRNLVGIAKDPKRMQILTANNLATGGSVRGGKGGIDDVPAMLTRGEFVINKRDAAKNRSVLEAINSGSSVSMFSKGGSTDNSKGMNYSMNSVGSVNDARTAIDMLLKTISGFAKNGTREFEKLSKVLNFDNISEGFYNNFNRSKKRIQFNKGFFDERVGAHELGHAVDYAGNPDGKVAPSNINGTINNIIAQAATTTATANAKQNNYSQIKTGNGTLEDHRAKSSEVYAELFSSLDDAGRKLLLEISSASTSAAEVDLGLTKLGFAIQRGEVKLDPKTRSNIGNTIESRLGTLRDQPLTYVDTHAQDKMDRETKFLIDNGYMNDSGDYIDSDGGAGRTIDVESIQDFNMGLDESYDKLKKQTMQYAMIAGGAAVLADSLDLLPKSVSTAAAAFGTGAASVYAISTSLNPLIEGLNKRLNNYIAGVDSATNSIKLSTVANNASTTSEYKEVAANELAAKQAMLNGKGMNNFANVLTGLTHGLAVTIGLYSMVNVMQTEYINNLRKENDQIAEKIKSGKGEETDLKKMLESARKDGDAAFRKDRALGDMVSLGAIGATAGAWAGGTTGATVGSAIPVVGNIVGGAAGGTVGGALGGAIGSGVGYLGNQFLGDSEAYQKATIDSTHNLYRLATATIDLENAMKKIGDSSTENADKVRLSTEVFDKIRSEFGSARMTHQNVDYNTSQDNGWIDTIGVRRGWWKEGAKSKSQKEIFDRSNQNITGLSEALSAAATNNISQIKDLVMYDIQNARSDNDLKKLESLLPDLTDTLHESFVASSKKGKLDDRLTEANEFTDAYKKQVGELISMRSQEIERMRAVTSARTLEIEAIRNTASSIVSLAEQLHKIELSGNLLEDFTNNYSRGVSSNRFNNIGNVLDLDSFKRDVYSVASGLQNGDNTASRVITGAEFISQFRDISTSQMVKEFDSLRKSGLTASSTKEIQAVLEKHLPSYSNLSNSQRGFAVDTIRSSIEKEEFSLDTLDKSINQITSLFQKDADVLARQADVTNEQVERIKASNEILAQSYAKAAELQSGLYDIELRRAQREDMINSNNSFYGESDRASLRSILDDTREKAAKSNLVPFGLDQLSGNTSRLSDALKHLNSELSTNKGRLQTEFNPAARSELVTENQRLSSAIQATTNELVRLSDQSAKASDVMSDLENAQRQRSMMNEDTRSYVLGGSRERNQMMQMQRGVMQVMQSGSFQGVSQDIRKDVYDRMNSMSQFDTTGAFKKQLESIIANDAARLGIGQDYINSYMGQRTSEEQKQIDRLANLTQQEIDAQKVLLDNQRDIIKASHDLVNQISRLSGIQGNSAPSSMMTPSAIGNYNNPIPTPIDNSQLINDVMTVSQSILQASDSFRNLSVSHNVNINGQVNIGGINTKTIEQELAKGLENFIVQKVTETINNSQKGFRAG